MNKGIKNNKYYHYSENKEWVSNLGRMLFNSVTIDCGLFSETTYEIYCDKCDYYAGKVPNWFHEKPYVGYCPGCINILLKNKFNDVYRIISEYLNNQVAFKFV